MAGEHVMMHHYLSLLVSHQTRLWTDVQTLCGKPNWSDVSVWPVQRAAIFHSRRQVRHSAQRLPLVGSASHPVPSLARTPTRDTVFVGENMAIGEMKILDKLRENLPFRSSGTSVGSVRVVKGYTKIRQALVPLCRTSPAVLIGYRREETSLESIVYAVRVLVGWLRRNVSRNQTRTINSIDTHGGFVTTCRG